MKITRDITEEKSFEPLTDADRRGFYEKLNGLRRDHKVNPLTEDKELTKSAQAWADLMAENDKAENGTAEDQGECLYSYRYFY